MRRWWVRRDKDEPRRAQPRTGKRVKPLPGKSKRKRGRDPDSDPNGFLRYGDPFDG